MANAVSVSYKCTWLALSQFWDGAVRRWTPSAVRQAVTNSSPPGADGSVGSAPFDILEFSNRFLLALRPCT
jgi:hypothetical protein